MKFKKEQVETLRHFIPNVDQLIAEEEYRELMIQLFYVISDHNISEDDYELDETGLMLERLYHEIMQQNLPKRSLFSRLFRRKTGL